MTFAEKKCEKGERHKVKHKILKGKQERHRGGGEVKPCTESEGQANAQVAPVFFYS